MIQQYPVSKFPIKKTISAIIILWWGIGNILLFTLFLSGKSINEPCQFIAGVELGLALLGLLWFAQYLRKKGG